MLASAIGPRRSANRPARIVRDLRPEGHMVEDDLLLLAAEVSQ